MNDEGGGKPFSPPPHPPGGEVGNRGNTWGETMITQHNKITTTSNSFAYWMHTWSDNLGQNSSNGEIFERKIKRE